MNNYTTKSPILFLVFNRPDTTLRVFEQIRNAQPKKLYIAADGPRENNDNDKEKCNKVKEIVSKVDWDCEIETLYREKNLGCKYAVSSSITWFFEKEEKGIILEDDCLPSIDFFRFCDEMLCYYEDDTRVRFITGSNFQNGIKRSDATYYFSKLSHVWGWASWRRVWKDYDVELKKYESVDYQLLFKNIFSLEILAEDWSTIFSNLLQNKINTWDYQLAITNMFNNGLSVIPNVNMISNIGFGNDATHTFETNGFDNLEYGELEGTIIHPKTFVISHEADLYTMYREHNIEARERNRVVEARRKRRNAWKFWKKKSM